MKCVGIPQVRGRIEMHTRVLVIKPEGKRSLGMYRRELANNIKMDLRK